MYLLASISLLQMSNKYQKQIAFANHKAVKETYPRMQPQTVYHFDAPNSYESKFDHKKEKKIATS